MAMTCFSVQSVIVAVALGHKPKIMGRVSTKLLQTVFKHALENISPKKYKGIVRSTESLCTKHGYVSLYTGGRSCALYSTSFFISW